MADPAALARSLEMILAPNPSETPPTITPSLTGNTTPTNTDEVYVKHIDESIDSISSSLTMISTLSDISADYASATSIAINTCDRRNIPNTLPTPVTKSPTASGYPVTKEIWWNTSMQIAIPFFLAGCGTIGAGYVLSVVQDWDVFKTIKALFILVPSLVGLKGNLDTCLASRLSTQANLGNLKNNTNLMPMVIGNVGLVQVQSILSSLLVSVFAITVGSIMEQEIVLKYSLIVCASAMAAATTSCFILDLVLIAVIVVSNRLNVNPDNIAAPFAASIGDIVSLGLLSSIASFLYTYYDNYPWIPWLMIASYIFIFLPLWIWRVKMNESVSKLLTTGWVPIVSALLISGTGGIVLDSAVNMYLGFVVFQPIINGIGGNLVSIQSSRIATMLHQSAELGELPPQSPSVFVKPWKPLFKGLPHAATARILLVISIPGHLVFIVLADYLYAGYISFTWEFVVLYVSFAVFQVLLLMYMAHVLTHVMWKRKIDPDSAAVPFLTSTGDLLGTALLFIVFYWLEAINRSYQLPENP